MPSFAGQTRDLCCVGDLSSEEQHCKFVIENCWLRGPRIDALFGRGRFCSDPGLSQPPAWRARDTLGQVEGVLPDPEPIDGRRHADAYPRAGSVLPWQSGASSAHPGSYALARYVACN